MGKVFWTRRRRVSVFRNTSDLRWGAARLPVKQRLIWAGPVFVLIQPARKVS